MKPKSYTFIITKGNRSLYSYLILLMIVVAILAFVIWMINFFLGGTLLSSSAENYVRLTFAFSLVLGGICVKIRPPMDFIEGAEISEKSIFLLDEDKELRWSEIDIILVRYSSYRNEKNYEVRSFFPKSGYDNNLIIKTRGQTLKYDFYVSSAEQANSLFAFVSSLESKIKPIKMEIINDK